MRYYHQPPTLKTYTPFFRSSAVRKAKEMVAWADREYQTALELAGKGGHYRTHYFLTKEWSGFRVLSQLENFRWFCAMLNQNEDVWNELDRHTRTFIRKAYDLYELLRPPYI